jgi:hypothetical protein
LVSAFFTGSNCFVWSLTKTIEIISCVEIHDFCSQQTNSEQPRKSGNSQALLKFDVTLVFEKHLSFIMRNSSQEVQIKGIVPKKTEFLQSAEKTELVLWKKQNPVAFG